MCCKNLKHPWSAAATATPISFNVADHLKKSTFSLYRTPPTAFSFTNTSNEVVLNVCVNCSFFHQCMTGQLAVALRSKTGRLETRDCACQNCPACITCFERRSSGIAPSKRPPDLRRFGRCHTHLIKIKTAKALACLTHDAHE